MNTKKEATQKNYSGIADLYTTDFGKDYEHFDTYLRQLVETLQRNNLQAAIVDLGTGPGNVIDYLLSLSVGNPLIATDFVQEFCEFLKKKYQEQSQVSVMQGDFTEYVAELQPESVSAFVANYSVIHIPDEEVDQFFSNVHSALQPGGLFAFSVWEGQKKGMEREPYQVQEDSRLKIDEPLESYLNNFTVDELTQRLTKAGFTIIKIEQFEPTMLPGEFPQGKVWALVQK